MAQAKYRPTLTMDEIEALINACESSCYDAPHLGSAIRTLKMFKFKADMGVNQPASITTGNKPGPTSKVDIIKADISSEYDKQRKELPYGQALAAAETYKNLGMPVPQDIQTIIDAGE